MNVVTTLEQIENNIAELERGRATIGNAGEGYKALIKRGTCFLPYRSKIGLSFAPSRFIGYVGNKLESHADNSDRDGRVTNVAINQLLGSRPGTNAALEKLYIEFCGEIGVTPSQTGAFGIERKYWVTAEVFELLEDNAENEIAQNPEITETEKQQLIRARVGQGVFRQRIINMWKKCCVTGCSYISMLRASHIKPWKDSTNIERLDEFNGLLLSPNLDALFDEGLISFTDGGDMLTSKLLSADVRKTLGIPIRAKVRLEPEHAKYMHWHREKVFADAPA